MQRMTSYQRLFTASYAKALNLPLQITISSVSCGGTTLFSDGQLTLPLPQPARLKRRLLGELRPAAAAATVRAAGDAAAAAKANGLPAANTSSSGASQQQQQQSRYLVMVEVITRFAVAGPADADAKDSIVSGVLSSTSETLKKTLSAFFGAPAIIRDIQSLGSGVLVGLNPNATADHGAAAAAEVAAVAAATAAAEDATTDTLTATASSADDDDLVASVELDLPLDLDITLDEEPIAETFIPPSFDFDFGSGEDPLTAAFAALDLHLPQMPADQPSAEVQTVGAEPVTQQPADSTAASSAAASGEDSSAAGLRLGQGGALMSAEEGDDVAAVADSKQQQQQQQQQQKRQAATVLAAPWQQVDTDHHHHHHEQQGQTLGYAPPATAPAAAAAGSKAAAMQTSKGSQQPVYTPYTPLPPAVPVDLLSLLGTTARSRRSSKPAELAAAAAMPSPPAPAAVVEPAQPQHKQTEPEESYDVYTPWEGAGDAAAFAKAPPCPFPLKKQHALVDRQGRFIGWNKGAECMFRPAATRPAYQQQQQQQGKAPVSWEQAPACSFAPTKDNVVWDRLERGWSQEQGQSCAFRVSHAIAESVGARS
jgi:hypothetical protein